MAGLRSAASRYPADPDLGRLLDDLRAGSAEFREPWDDGVTGVWRHRTKTLDHPVVGPLTLECDTLVVPDVDQTLHVFSAAPGTPAHDALALLLVVGTQQAQRLALTSCASGAAAVGWLIRTWLPNGSRMPKSVP
nr:hypothetical protein [Angustibacter aerolatus]